VNTIKPWDDAHDGSRHAADDGGVDEDRWDQRLNDALALVASAGPNLSADRLAHHKEILMHQITDTPVDATTEPAARAVIELEARPERHGRLTRRRRLLLGAVITVAAASVAVPAAADQVQQWLHHAPTTMQEADQMQVLYNGGTYTVAQLQVLQAQGKAMVTVEEPATFSKGIMQAFDTSAEADAWACTHVSGRAGRANCVGTPSPTRRP
jgi:hypothetical protein